jgi:TorA maturation chaperone TorD
MLGTAVEETLTSGLPTASVDETDVARARLYGLLAGLLLRAPTAETLFSLSALKGDATPLGLASIGLAQASAAASGDECQREYFDLFIGVGRGELLPYASYYLTGFLNERPLARVREDLTALGVERVAGQVEPEDHLGILCEVMAGLAMRAFEADAAFERRFFERHLQPWAARFFTDLEAANAAKLYRAVGTLGRLFIEIETQAFAMDAPLPAGVRPGDGGVRN